MGFQDAVMTGMSRDGGLLLPESIPLVSAGQLRDWAGLSYQDLAFEIMNLFTDFDPVELRRIIASSYESFRHPDITPVVEVGDVHILELFHGPTLAFKDIALQFLGNVFEHILARSGKELNILAATSGDTGSAAIYGVRGRKGIRIYVMHPEGRVSPVQERQMTSVLDDNVFNIAIDGTFDDCQNILKATFQDLDLKDDYSLGTVNSINWARVLAQIVYYFHGVSQVQKSTGAKRVQVSVPTGNFGDIFAGYLAVQMGLPISTLILATNENDILSRFFKSGDYERRSVSSTLSPSMDIQIASNFERYLYYRTGEDGCRVADLMAQFSEGKNICIPPDSDGRVDPLIQADQADSAATLATISDMYKEHGYLLDPHTAVGVHVGRSLRSPDEPLLCLATAHPAKFGDAIEQATGEDLAHHSLLDVLDDLPTRCTRMPADSAAIRDFLIETIAPRVEKNLN